MFNFDLKKVVLLDETGENSNENKIANEKAIKHIRQHETLVEHLDTGNDTPRVLVEGKVEKHGLIGNLKFIPMEGFSETLKVNFLDALFNRKPFK